MPLYYAVYTWISDMEPYWWPLQRAVPTHYAKALLPATLVGYVLPTILMFVPWTSSAAAQYAETIWQPSPLYVPILTMAIGASYKNLERRKDKLTLDAKKSPVDVGYLKQVYLVTGILGCALHWAVLLDIVSRPGVSLTSVFVPDFSPHPKPLGDGLQNIFLADFWGFFVASYVWCVSAVWDLKRVGRTTTNVAWAASVTLLAQFLVGPGTTVSAIWYWREEVMAIRLFKRAEKVHRD
jgi:hypothetical protein